MNFNDYLLQVYNDAEYHMMMVYDLYNWESMWDELYKNITDTAYCQDEDIAINNAKHLIWNDSFKTMFQATMGYEINQSCAILFDKDVKIFCLKILKEALHSRYMAMVLFGVTGHVELPKKYLI